MNVTRQPLNRLVGLTALIASLCACVAGTAAPAGPPATSAGPISSTHGAVAERSIIDVFAERGETCVRTASVSRRSPTDEELKSLSDAAATKGTDGGWLLPDADALAPGQAYLGSLDTAAKAYGGVIVGPAEDPWVDTEREGKALAVRLARIDLGNGRAAWVVVGRMLAVDCP